MSDIATAPAPFDPDDEILPEWMFEDEDPVDDPEEGDRTRYAGR